MCFITHFFTEKSMKNLKIYNDDILITYIK